ncbi:hypothetical protein E1200_11890 [Actinomadura sp. GC306]|uniref:hypothetical protein n=1 Tax=Actinomadura sp. GC306 TaxID=2530367 RepID=UPI00104AE9FC|nr:hypothetical protein [Actinomadura sp. GC306]TDC68342.1 hypothetical protein E1200_11890 [Actinomadura sp. GC306]
MGPVGAGGDDRAVCVKARETSRDGEDGVAVPVEGTAGDYARQTMVSSAQAHERAARLLEEMADAHPEEAEAHRQSARRHLKWAENDRKLAERYAPRNGDPDRR